jgi:hypothetical protein
MRKKLLAPLALVACLVCGLVSADGGNVRTYQTVNMFRAGMPSMTLQSAATLVRSQHGVEMRVAATHLDPNSAYTVWWVVFNRPAGCLGPCGSSSLAVPAARASVFYAAGFMTGDDGTGNVTAHMEDGTLPIGLEVTADGTVVGMDRGNGFAAEIQLVVRAHGAILVGTAHEQIGSFNGGCPPNTCMNQQVAVFPPVARHAEDE